MLFTPGPVQPPYVAAPLVSGKTGQLGQARQPRRRERPCWWHRVGIRGGRSGEEVGHVETGGLTEEHNGDEWRLEAELVDGAHILTNVIDAVAAAQRGVVVPEDVPGKTDARAPARGDAVIEGGSGGISRQSPGPLVCSRNWDR